VEQDFNQFPFAQGKPTPADIRFDTSKLSWVKLRFELMLKLNTTERGLDSPEGRRHVMGDTFLAIPRVTEAFGPVMLENGKKLGRLMDLGREQHTSLFPWLPGAGRSLVSQEISKWSNGPQDFDIRSPLPGQRKRNINAPVGLVKIVPSRTLLSSDPSVGIPIAVIEITAISFQEGSLWSWIQGNVLVLTLGATILVPMVPPAQDAVRAEWAIHQRRVAVEMAMRNQPAVEFGNFRFSEEALRRRGERAFNYQEARISSEERRYRIALTQLALKMIVHTEITIDGEVGPETIEALKEVGRRNHTSGVISNPFLREKLEESLLPVSER
jgi:hypothetical protein